MRRARYARCGSWCSSSCCAADGAKKSPGVLPGRPAALVSAGYPDSAGIWDSSAALAAAFASRQARTLSGLSWEPVSGFEPLTCRLQEACPGAVRPLPAPMPYESALAAPKTRVFLGDPFHDPFHGGGGLSAPRLPIRVWTGIRICAVTVTRSMRWSSQKVTGFADRAPRDYPERRIFCMRRPSRLCGRPRA